MSGRSHPRQVSRPSREDVARLVDRAADGDQQAWRALVDEFGGLVRAVIRAYRLSEHDAADIGQNTWMRLVENLDRIRDPACVGPWLAKTARRECLGVIRRTRRHVPLEEEVLSRPSLAEPIDEALIGREQAVAMRAALQRLGERDRALLGMLVADPRPSYDEISVSLGLAIGSIGPTRARALTKLGREAERMGLVSRSELCVAA